MNPNQTTQPSPSPCCQPAATSSFKVLLFLRESSIAPKGGPAGYVYNLLSGMDPKRLCSEGIQLDLLPPLPDSKKSLYDALPQGLKNTWRMYARYKEFQNSGRPAAGIDSQYLNQYDAIHFHSPFALYANKELLKDYKGKILLTSHSPKPPHLEKWEDQYTKAERMVWKLHKDVYEAQALEAYGMADAIIYPCPQAREAYQEGWPAYRDLEKEKTDCLHYLPTGAASCKEKVQLSREQVRQKYGIPQDAFVISYTGRHNEVKGYDILKEIARLFDLQDNVWFLVAGEESPLERPNLPFWREAGWIRDPYSLEAASDLFVLPNRQTYFDLVLLEVLSLGIPVLATYTGGNKFFENQDGNIYYFRDAKDGAAKIRAMQQGILKREGYKNIELYEKEYTSQTFAKNYIQLLKSLLDVQNQ